MKSKWLNRVPAEPTADPPILGDALRKEVPKVPKVEEQGTFGTFGTAFPKECPKKTDTKRTSGSFGRAFQGDGSKKEDAELVVLVDVPCTCAEKPYPHFRHRDGTGPASGKGPQEWRKAGAL